MSETMNPAAEFERLKVEHQRNQLDVNLRSYEETEAYLNNLCPLEEFFRNLRSSGVWYPVCMGERSMLYEDERFDFQYRKANICVARHFRFAVHLEHKHNYFQMVYVHSGIGTITIDGEDMTVGAGDFMLISPGLVHAVNTDDENCVIIKTYIRRSTFEKTFFEWLGESNMLSEFFRHAIYGEDSGNWLLFHTKGDGDLSRLALRLYAEMMNHRDYYRIVGEAELTELFCRLVRDHIDGAVIDEDRGEAVSIGRIIKYMQQNYRTATLEDTAYFAGYTKNYLCRLISESTGSTFSRIINELRIEAACRLLRSSELGSAEIGYHCGYNSPEYFYRMFKRLRGMTPQEYRGGSRENADEI